jgi:hypothetical protein
VSPCWVTRRPPLDLGGLLGTGVYYLAVTYAERFPAIHGVHDAWRYTLLSGLLPAVPLMLIRPFLPKSPVWREQRSRGTSAQPSIFALFRPSLRMTTLVTALSVACLFAIAYGVLQQTPRMIPGLTAAHALVPRQVEQTISSVQFFQELGSLSGRLLFALLVARVMSQRRLLRIFPVPGLFVFSFVYFYAATHSLLPPTFSAKALAAPAQVRWVDSRQIVPPETYPCIHLTARRKTCQSEGVSLEVSAQFRLCCSRGPRRESLLRCAAPLAQ